jgi:adenosylcobyric acid synthase
MALNSAVTIDGYEISRSQIMQAEAARTIPRVEMNPVLLKPKEEMRAEVILKGRPYGDFSTGGYWEQGIPLALEVVRNCLRDLRQEYELVIIEGAGSPAEVNLKANDIANMRIAQLADAPVLLAGDIDRGGCLAAIIGTLELLTPEERSRVKGLIINKFRGDLSLLQPGLDFLEERTGIPVLGVLPYLNLKLPEEDSQVLEKESAKLRGETASKIKAGVIRFPRIANFNDFDALAYEPDLDVAFINEPTQLDDCDLVILPDTQNTTVDLAWLNQTGFAAKIRMIADQIVIFGIGGGFQMLGKEILDPYHFELEEPSVTGLYLLPVTTRFEKTPKTLRQVKGYWIDENGFKSVINGYEIHHGVSEIGSAENLFRLESGLNEGCRAGKVYGTYLHGCFDNDGFRNDFLNRIRKEKGLPVFNVTRSFRSIREESYCKLAEALRSRLDMVKLIRIMGCTDVAL